MYVDVHDKSEAYQATVFASVYHALAVVALEKAKREVQQPRRLAQTEQ